MATTGETIWASLMARQKIIYTSHDIVRSAHLSFSFGPYTHFRDRPVPLRDFRFSDRVFEVSNRFRPGVYLHFALKKRKGLLREELKFKLSWPYLVTTPKKGIFRFTFPLRNENVLVALQSLEAGKWSKAKKVPFVQKTFYNPRQGVRWRFTPAQLFNLSLIAGTLAPAGSKTVGVSTRTRSSFQRKTGAPRLSPEIRNEQHTFALEIYPSPYSSMNANREIFRRSWTGTTTPGFGKTHKGLLPINGHTVSLVHTDRNQGYDLRRKIASPNTTYSNAWSPDVYFGLALISQPILITDSQFSMVANTAVKKLNANANVGVQANMAQNLAQYRQTTNMIAQTATRIAGSMLALKKGQLSRAAEILVEGRPNTRTIQKGVPSRSKSVANNWLQLQYGWKPLLSDCEQSMKGLANYMVGSASLQTVKGVAVHERMSRPTIYGPIEGALPPVGVVNNTAQWSCRYGCQYRTTNHMLSYLSQLGFTNPINLVWEILPYSFVVDWFIPIGPYLESMSAPHGLEFVRGYKTLFGRRYITASSGYSGKMPGDSTSEFRCYGLRSELSVVLDRTKLTAWPVQSFPTFKNPFSTTHVLNALALMRQAFSNR